jgi:hypothetical protein
VRDDRTCFLHWPYIKHIRSYIPTLKILTVCFSSTCPFHMSRMFTTENYFPLASCRCLELFKFPWQLEWRAVTRTYIKMRVFFKIRIHNICRNAVLTGLYVTQVSKVTVKNVAFSFRIRGGGKKKNSVALVRKRTIPYRSTAAVGEVSANFCG